MASQPTPPPNIPPLRNKAHVCTQKTLLQGGMTIENSDSQQMNLDYHPQNTRHIHAKHTSIASLQKPIKLCRAKLSHTHRVFPPGVFLFLSAHPRVHVVINLPKHQAASWRQGIVNPLAWGPVVWDFRGAP